MTETRCTGRDARPGHGFTLLELLVAVGIVLILASIATASVAEMSMRTKVARVRADLRTLAVAVEAYGSDHQAFPPTPRGEEGARCPLSGRQTEPVSGVPPNVLTTPIAYSQLAGWVDPLATSGAPQPCQRLLYTYHRSRDILVPELLRAAFLRAHYGQEWDGWFLWSVGADAWFPERAEAADKFAVEYDPTNGTFSAGGIRRFR